MQILILALPLMAALGGTKGLEERRLDHPWGRWHAGAWVRTESTSTSHAGSVLVERDQLIGTGSETYELESVLEVEGGDVTTELNSSWAMGGHAYALGDAQLVGTESLTIEGRQHECEVWEGRWTQGGQTFAERTWVSADLSYPVRAVTRGGGIELDVSMTRTREFTMVKDRKLECMRLEGRGSVRGAPVSVTLWMSAHVPGGLVRRETRTKGASGEQVMIKQVTEFHGELARGR